MVSFINLFFVPVLSVWLHYRRAGQAPAAEMRLPLLYCLYTPLVYLGAKLLSRLASLLTPVYILPDTATYTAFALLAAALLPLLREFCRKYLGLEIGTNDKAREK